MSSDETRISVLFARGARRVTGSNFLVEATKGTDTTRILIDCGLAQGERFCNSVNAEKFQYDPGTVDALFFTHAHADHIGLFPKLVKDGFHGRAYATAPTRTLMPIMLEDSSRIIADEAKRCHEEAPYQESDIHRAVSLVTAVSYHEPITVAPGITATLYNAGHIIGSASVALDVFGTRLLFTGDLGRVPPVIVPERDIPEGVDYLFMESVYGDRLHESAETSERALREAVADAVRQKGTLLIPAFSLERTQIILEILDRIFSEHTTPVPTFLDSPLAAKITEVYERSPEFLNDAMRARIQNGDTPFSFPALKITEDPEESHAIEHASNPKIIIAGAGMSHGGRIRYHEMRNLSDRRTILLIPGYQAAGSLGRRLADGAKSVVIDGTDVSVRASIRVLDGFSAHADRDDLMAYVEAVRPKQVYVILGETQSSAFIAQRIQGFLSIPSDVPREGETVVLKPQK